MYTIYRITCIPTGKVYIGKTCKSARKRWCEHVSKARHKADTYFTRAIAAHGANNFVVEEIAWAADNDKAAWIERHFIAFYELQNPSVGFNTTRGGEGFGHKHSKPTKDRISKTIKRFFAEHGHPLRGKNKRRDIPDAHIAELYQQGLSSNTIAERFNTTPPTIRWRLRKLGLRLRTAASYNRNNYNRNKGVFMENKGLIEMSEKMRDCYHTTGKDFPVPDSAQGTEAGPRGLVMQSMKQKSPGYNASEGDGPAVWGKEGKGFPEATNKGESDVPTSKTSCDCSVSFSSGQIMPDVKEDRL